MTLARNAGAPLFQLPYLTPQSGETQAWRKARCFLGYKIQPLLHFQLSLPFQRTMTNHFLRTRYLLRQGRRLCFNFPSRHRKYLDFYLLLCVMVYFWLDLLFFCFKTRAQPSVPCIKWVIVKLAVNKVVVGYSQSPAISSSDQFISLS